MEVQFLGHAGIKIEDDHKNPSVDDMYLKHYEITKNRKYSAI